MIKLSQFGITAVAEDVNDTDFAKKSWRPPQADAPLSRPQKFLQAITVGCNPNQWNLADSLGFRTRQRVLPDGSTVNNPTGLGAIPGVFGQRLKAARNGLPYIGMETMSEQQLRNMVFEAKYAVGFSHWFSLEPDQQAKLLADYSEDIGAPLSPLDPAFWQGDTYAVTGEFTVTPEDVARVAASKWPRPEPLTAGIHQYCVLVKAQNARDARWRATAALFPRFRKCVAETRDVSITKLQEPRDPEFLHAVIA